MKIRVKTIWNGRVGIRDKQIKEAQKSGQKLVIVVGDEKMTIPYSEINNSIVAVSEYFFKDYFSNDLHRLIYFKWAPDSINQKTLF